MCGELGLHDPFERIPPLVWEDDVEWVLRPCPSGTVGEAVAPGHSDGVQEAAPVGPAAEPVEVEAGALTESTTRAEMTGQAEAATPPEPAAEVGTVVQVAAATSPEPAAEVGTVVQVAAAMRPEAVAAAEVAARAVAVPPKAAVRAGLAGQCGFAGSAVGLGRRRWVRHSESTVLVRSRQARHAIVGDAGIAGVVILPPPDASRRRFVRWFHSGYFWIYVWRSRQLGRPPRRLFVGI
ncbi:hypothetical protein [Paractinoplanes atraurantiacus]|uniref:hypothetical protein n=1 Tax=Paractinoplanes atraurantiacus TaxID=1036182 RepID=UPI0015CF46A2|nr:hypothetical protein [Actinoplanes atraurantiacus]